MTYLPHSLIRSKSPRTGLYLPGTANDYPSCPTSAGIQSVTGDIDIRWWGAITTHSTTQILLTGHGNGASGINFTLRLESSAPRFFWSVDGTNLSGSWCSVGVPFANGDFGGIRTFLDVDNGSGSKSVTFQIRNDDDISSSTGWTQLGNVNTTSGTTSIFPNSLGLAVGHYTNNSATTSAIGIVGKVELRNGIDGTVVASPDFTTPVGPRHRDAQGNIWTINGSTWSWKDA